MTENPTRPKGSEGATSGSAAGLPADARNGGKAADLKRILVIKHGALGDFILSLGPMQAIRAHHLGAHITLLTTRPFVALAERSGYFDEVWTDDRPRWNLRDWLELRSRLIGGKFDRVYDLQTSGRSSRYMRLFPRPLMPQWSGIASGCSHPHSNRDRDRMHTIERQAEQLSVCGIAHVPHTDLRWATAEIAHYRLPTDYVLLVPGGSAHRPGKRWPAIQFAKLARMLAADGIRPVLIGAESEAKLLAQVATDAPQSINLCGKTDFFQLAELARRARGTVGNDTGPMHLFAATGCPSLVLFSSESDPALCAPRGRKVRVLRVESLKNLDVNEVAGAMTDFGVRD